MPERRSEGLWVLVIVGPSWAAVLRWIGCSWNLSVGWHGHKWQVVTYSHLDFFRSSFGAGDRAAAIADAKRVSEWLGLRTGGRRRGAAEE